MRRCLKCGAEYRGNPTFCPLDGSALQEQAQPERAFGGWKVRETLADGVLASVYRATRNDEVGALKTYTRTAPLSRAQRESEAQARVAHPNVACLLDSGVTDDGAVYLVTEFVARGVTLKALIAQRSDSPQRMGWREAANIALQVAAGLEAIHAAGLIHRDLKPANIMVDHRATNHSTVDHSTVDHGVQERSEHDDAPRVTILDLGHALALDLDRLTQSGLVWGSALYMSPEQAAALPVDARSDLYSLGVVLYEMLCGRPPFQARAAADVMQMHWQQPPPPLAVGIPSELADVCLWLLAKKEQDRPPSARVVSSVLEGITRSKGTSSTDQHSLAAPTSALRGAS